jgi:hypothetical protein
VNCEVQITQFPATGNAPAAGEIMVVKESCVAENEMSGAGRKVCCWLEHSAAQGLEYVRLVSKHNSLLI